MCNIGQLSLSNRLSTDSDSDSDIPPLMDESGHLITSDKEKKRQKLRKVLEERREESQYSTPFLFMSTDRT